MKDSVLQRTPIFFLQAVTVLIGIGVLAFLIWEPQVEGVNAHATNFEIYFNLFIAVAYTGSLAFFVALYKAFRLLGYIGQQTIFSENSIKALQTIRYCAYIILGFMAAAEGYLMIVRPEEDIAGGVAMGLFISLGAVIAASASATFERVLRSALDSRR